MTPHRQDIRDTARHARYQENYRAAFRSSRRELESSLRFPLFRLGRVPESESVPFVLERNPAVIRGSRNEAKVGMLICP